MPPAAILLISLLVVALLWAAMKKRGPIFDSHHSVCPHCQSPDGILESSNHAIIPASSYTETERTHIHYDSEGNETGYTERIVGTHTDEAKPDYSVTELHFRCPRCRTYFGSKIRSDNEP